MITQTARTWRLLVVLFGLCLAGGLLPAQETIDPNDRLYLQLQIWQSRGLLDNLPPLRPYATQLIIEFLTKVESSPLATARDLALVADLRSWQGDGAHLGLNADVRLAGDGSASDPQNYEHLQPEFLMQGMVTDWLGAGANFKLYAVDNASGALVPAGTRPAEDFIADWSDIDLGGKNLQIRQIMHGMVSLGIVGGDIQGQVGFVRNSIGPFWDNGIIVGPQAPVSGHFSLLFRQPGVDFTMAILPLVATTDTGSGINSEKVFYYHNLTVHPVAGLDLSVFESIVSGRLDPLYFIPLASYFHLQGLTGFGDNSLLGLSARGKIIDGLDLKGVLYLDDLDFNGIVRFNWNTKWKLAFQLGTSLSPQSIAAQIATATGADVSVAVTLLEWFPLLSADYAAVMPYMYTHINTGSTTYNVENYTHWGANLGPALEPNSDRLDIKMHFVPFDQADIGRLDLGFNTRVMRHGNASAGIIPGADGSIFDSGYLNGVPTFQGPFVDSTGQPVTRFLSQSILEQTLQLGINLDWTIGHGANSGAGRNWGDVKLGLAYTFEHVWNSGLVAGSEANRHYLDISLGYSY